MLNKKQKYLQIALNSTLEEAQKIISQIPLDKRIILEAGTPLIKAYGAKAIRAINSWWMQRIFEIQVETAKRSSIWTREIGSWPRWFEKLLRSMEKESEFFSEKSQKFFKTGEASFSPYIVADLKCMDRGAREVKIALNGGANAAVALGQAPIETLDAFIAECERYNLDAMIDMMNVEYPLNVLRQLKKLPQVVILHRGVDEEAFNPEKEIPFHEIHRIKENYDIMIAIAGGDTFQEVQRAIFNDADIVVVWKSFYQSTSETAKLAEQFLKEIR
jgi:3-keto-L-gulonate-6-phosphate decarboxylase